MVNLGVTPLTLTITKTTGLFTGSVTDPGTGKALRYSGAIFQKANSASGFLLGPTRSARVTVSDQLSN